MDWHGVIERAVDRHPVPAFLVRFGASADVEVPITVAHLSYNDLAVPSGGSVDQQSDRWMVPARRLEAAGFPMPPLPGDVLMVPAQGLQGRVTIAAPGWAGGALVRYDLTVSGPGGAA